MYISREDLESHTKENDYTVCRKCAREIGIKEVVDGQSVAFSLGVVSPSHVSYRVIFDEATVSCSLVEKSTITTIAHAVVMKLYLVVSIALSLVGAALSSPQDEYYRRMYQPTYGNYVGAAQYFQPYPANVNMQRYTAGDVNQPVAQYYPTGREGKLCIFVCILVNYTLKVP